jgi:hypothetical protein
VADPEPADQEYEKSEKPKAEAETKKTFSMAGITTPDEVIVSLVSATFGIGIDENLTL